MGWLAMASARSSSPSSIMSVTIGVAMVPGRTALIRIPLGAYSSAALLVNPSAVFGGVVGRPTWNPDEPTEG